MRVRINSTGKYGAANTITLALVTLYGDPNVVETYRRERKHITAFMKRCTQTVPDDNAAQQRLRGLCPTAQRLKLYISEWGMDNTPSHYVILHRVSQPGLPDVFKLACARILGRTANSLDASIDGATIKWPSNNPEVACGQVATIERTLIAGAAVGMDILDNPVLQQELRTSVEAAQLYGGSKAEVAVWGHPGKTVFRVVDGEPVTLVRVRPYAPNVSKFNVILWGCATDEAVPQTINMPHHIVPQIKGAECYEPVDELEGAMLRWALESRLLPYIAISHTTQRGDIFTLTYDPEADEALVTRIAENHKIVGLPRVLRVPREAGDVYVPDLDLAARLKDLFFNAPAYRDFVRKLLRTMGYTEWEHYKLAFSNWSLPLTLAEEDRLAIMEAEL